ncbi:hypothetical protein E4T56_gene1995, partial [Termitomyces sp. T112]
SCNEHGQVPSGSFFLPSPRFKRALSSRLGHSRSQCEWESNSLNYGKAYWLNKTWTRCRFCKEDSLCTKLLVFLHYQRQAREIRCSQNEGDGNVDRKYQTTLDDDDPLESPRIHDLDDFDDWSKNIDDTFAEALFDETPLDDDIDDRSSGH